MKSIRLMLTLALLALLITSCGPPKGTFTFPAGYPNTIEGALIAPYTNLPSRLEFGNDRECRVYDMPDLAPSTQEVLDHYQAQLEAQGWQGDATMLSLSDERLDVTWLDEEHNSGVRVIYTPDVWLGIVCVGNP